MPIANIHDAREVERGLGAIFDARDTDDRARAIRSMFVETLDFDQTDRLVPLDAAKDRNLPSDARLLASRNGFSILYIPMDDAENNRVNAITASAAAKVIGDTIADEPLLLFTNRNCDQLHVIYPDLSGSRPRLQRMVAHRGHPGRTVVEQIANLWHDYGELGTTMGEAVSNAFNVEPVTSAFFRDYKNAYDDAVSLIAVKVRQGDAEQFTQTLFNRLLFVHFVSRKGWLRFNGDVDYLNAIWRDYQADATAKNFYTSRLFALFFDGLNNPDSRELSNAERPLIGRVPFLNGGLFEETDLDKRAANAVPDDVIKALLGDGERTGLFNRYNFTVAESTPLDTEVAVDPEMLGKLFEETVNERRSNGAYYTPRPVVAFMCREAIKGYLAGQGIANLDDAKIVDLVDQRNPDAITLMQAPEIYEAVKKIKAVDPACGSGAFLLGMLQELVGLNETLFRAGHTPESLYDQKLEIIKYNIYGADNDGLAVSTAMLRLWLSLAVDFEGDDTPAPLPNLDMKLVTGDTIAGPDPRMLTNSTAAPESQQMDFTALGIDASGLREYTAAYTNAQGQCKAEIWAKAEAIKADLRRRMPGAAPAGVVDWRIEFAYVMLNGGFDVVIANPPYGITVNDRRSAAIGHSDSYTNFMGLGCDLAPSGIMAYITPTSWETGDKFKKFRRYLFSKVALQSVVNLPYDVFEKPNVDTAITIAAIGKPPPSEFRLVTLDKRAELDLTKITEYLTSVNWGAVSGDGSLRVPLLDWAADLFSRVGAKATPLGEVTSSKRGIAEYKFDILKRQTDGALPFFDGQVQRYEVSPSSGRNFVVVSEREMKFHRGERFLTRRLVSRSNRLSFARTKDVFVVKEAILPIMPNFDDPHKLAAMLAIMNSSLMSFLYLSRATAAVKDDFRQVTLSGLRELPIIFPDAKTLVELAQLVADREKQDGDVAGLERRIDDIIYRTYGVTDTEQEAIAEWLALSG